MSRFPFIAFTACFFNVSVDSSIDTCGETVTYKKGIPAINFFSTKMIAESSFIRSIKFSQMVFKSKIHHIL